MYHLVCRQILSTLITVGLLSACVSNAPPQSLALGESIAIQPPVVKRLDVKVDSKAKRRSRGVVLGAAGAVGGAAVGAVGGAVYGMACGPMAWVCAPLAAVAGAGIGLVGGGGLGVATGRGGISGEKAEQFNEFTAQWIDEDELKMKLHEQFTASADSHWVIDRESPNTAILVIRSLRFAQEPGDNVQLVLDVEMEVILGDRAETFEFEHVGELRHVDDWLANGGECFQLEVDAAIEEVTRGMIVHLAPHDEVGERPSASLYRHPTNLCCSDPWVDHIPGEVVNKGTLDQPSTVAR